MRAAVFARYGPVDVLEVRDDLPLPTPRRGEIRVRVRAAALNPKDILVRKGKFAWVTGRRFPKGTGYDLAGVVDAVGPGDVGGHRVGDVVFGMIDGWSGRACAEHAVLSAGHAAPAPAGLTGEEAAALPLAGLTALQALRDDASLGPGERVLVHGASGGVGTLAVQIARAMGARVTAVTSHRNLDLVRALGAAEAIDYAVEDAFAGDERWDVVFDVFGNRTFDVARRALARGGRFVSTVPSPRILWDAARSLAMPTRARLVVVRSRRRDLDALRGLVEAGAVRPVIDTVFDLADVRAAHARVETKRARGKVVVTVP